MALLRWQERALFIPEEFDLFIGGGRGGGKSFLLILLALRHVEQYGSRARVLYVRRSHAGTEDAVATCRLIFGMVYGAAARFNANEGLWRFPGGGTLEVNQIENQGDFAKYQGRSFTLVLVDEAGQFAEPSLLDLLRSCLRGSGSITPRMILSANPGGVGHGWINRRHVLRGAPWIPYREEFSGRMYVNCPSTYRDNTFIDQDDYAAQLKAATATDAELGRAWADGDWTVAAGAYFSSVLEEHRVLIEPCRPIDIFRATATYRDGWHLFLGHDFGVAAPSATYVCGESPGGSIGVNFFPRGSILLLDELVTNEPGSLTRGMGYPVPLLAERIKLLCKRWEMSPEGVADDSIFARSGSATGSISKEFNAHGVFFRPARKADRLTGWEVMRRMLLDAGEIDKPGLYVARTCSYWWETIPVLPRDPRRPDDVDSRAADHAADATRYALGHQRGDFGARTIRESAIWGRPSPSRPQFGAVTTYYR